MGIQIKSVSKSYGSVRALHACSLDVATGELLTLLGPSGCGKTTLLRIIAGFLNPDSGEVVFDGRRVDGLPVRERNIAFIMENWGLYPHLDVFSNIAYPLRVRRVGRESVESRVGSVAHLLKIGHLLARRPTELSGGQRQRVAIARALIRDDARVLLADEPFSNLDAQLRYQMRAEFKELQRQKGLPCVFVTHDQDEALAIGDRVAVMNEGEIVQVGTSSELYHQPNSMFIAGFIGHPAMNLLPVRFVNGRMLLDDATVIEFPDTRYTYGGDEAVLGVRPEAVRLVTVDESQFAAEVTLVEHTEPDALVHLRVGEHRLIAKSASHRELSPRQNVGLALDARKTCLFDKKTGYRIDK
jgi:ABC-type sugar transport system ATPase subunit